MMRRVLVATVGVAAVALAAAGTGLAQRTSDMVTCTDGSEWAITVTSQPTDNSVGWGVGTISGGDHLIPTSFSGTVIDVATGDTLFSFTQAKGDGNGQHNQSQVTCSTEPEFDTAGDAGIPGVDPSTEVELLFTVTAVHKP